MTTEKKYSLIKRKESLKIFLGVVLKKILGKSKERVNLIIPPLTPATNSKFKSYLTENQNSKTAHEINSAEELIKLIKENNITGKGGAAFPTAEKISSLINSGEKAKILIINAVECDPGLLHDKWILENKMPQIIETSKILKNILNLDRIIFASKSEINSTAKEVETVRVENFYPAGAETVLIESLLNISIKPGDIPAEKGILVQNIQTILSLHNALFNPSSAKQQYLTFSNIKKQESTVILCETGTSVKKVCEDLAPGEKSLFIGGGVMQTRPAEDNDIIDSTVNFIAVSEPPVINEKGCVGCDQCISHCPTGINVKDGVEFIRGNSRKSFSKDEFAK